jgi:hypothetical protein
MTCQIERVNDELLYPNFGIAGKFVLQNSWIGLKGIGYRMKMETNFLNEQDGHFCGQAKLKPLLSRANLLIARDIEWANIMLAFEQVMYL